MHLISQDISDVLLLQLRDIELTTAGEEAEISHEALLGGCEFLGEYVVAAAILDNADPMFSTTFLFVAPVVSAESKET